MTTRTWALSVGVVLVTAMARGGDVNVMLDSSDGSSAFRVRNSGSNAIIEATSGYNLRLGYPAGGEFLDQQQTVYDWWTTIRLAVLAWQSFRPTASGRLTKVGIWHDQSEGSRNVTLSILDGEGAGGSVLWSKAVTLNNYWDTFTIDANVPVTANMPKTLRIVHPGSGNTSLGVSWGDRYTRGISSGDPDEDLMFQTWVISSESEQPVVVSAPMAMLGLGVDTNGVTERLTVAGNIVASGSATAASGSFSGVVHAASFTGNGTGLTNLNAAQLNSGTVPWARLPGGLITNNQSGVTLNGALFTGNIGIGVTNPVVGLEVSGTVRAVKLEDRDDTTYFVDPANAGTAARLNGNVGIGPVTPLYKLHVAGDSYAEGGIQTGVGSNGMGFRFGDVDVLAGTTTTLVQTVAFRLFWDAANKQIKLVDLWNDYTHFCGHKDEGAGGVFVRGYGTPHATNALATLDGNGEYIVVDIFNRNMQGFAHLYAYYDNGNLAATYYYRCRSQ